MCMTFIALQKILTALSLLLHSLPPWLWSTKDILNVCGALPWKINTNAYQWREVRKMHEPIACWSISSFHNACFFQSVSSYSDSTKSDEEGVLIKLVLRGEGICWLSLTLLNDISLFNVLTIDLRAMPILFTYKSFISNTGLDPKTSPDWIYIIKIQNQ